jgi:uncharacterized protein YkwD
MHRLSVTIAAVVLTLAARPLGAAAQMTDLESEIIAEMNLARTDPAGYATHLERLLPFFQGDELRLPGKVALQTREGARAVREAIAALRATPPMRRLTPARGLVRAARDHAGDQGPRGGMGHTGSDGSTMADRISRYGTWDVAVAENIAYGSSTARDVVVDLLVDDGVPGRGHRRNILNPESRFAGVGCARHTAYRVVCVIDYAARYRDAAAGDQSRSP